MLPLPRFRRDYTVAKIREAKHMSNFDLLIRHGPVAPASDTFAADVAVMDGRPMALGEAL